MVRSGRQLIVGLITAALAVAGCGAQTQGSGVATRTLPASSAPVEATSEDFADYGLAGVPSVLLHVGAVDPAKLAAARRTGVPVPAPHSPEWAPDLEPTLKAAIRAEVTALLELLRRAP